MTDAKAPHMTIGRRCFALCLALYVAISGVAIHMVVNHAQVDWPVETLGVATAVAWVSGSFAGLFNVGVMLGGTVVSLAAMAFLARTPARPSLIFEAYLIIVFAGVTPLSAVLLMLNGSGPIDAAGRLSAPSDSVQGVSVAVFTITVVYVWWFLRTRFDRSSGDAALATLAGVAAAYAFMALIRLLSSTLGLT